MPKQESEELFDAKDVAELLNVSSMTVKRWIESGKISCSHHYKNHMLFTQSDINVIAVTFSLVQRKNNVTPVTKIHKPVHNDSTDQLSLGDIL